MTCFSFKLSVYTCLHVTLYKLSSATAKDQLRGDNPERVSTTVSPDTCIGCQDVYLWTLMVHFRKDRCRFFNGSKEIDLSLVFLVSSSIIDLVLGSQTWHA